MKVQYKVHRKKSLKRLTLRVTDDAEIVVCAPLTLSSATIEKFVLSKANWIEKRFENLKELIEPQAERNWQAGENFLILGESYKLVVSPSVEKASLNNGALVVPLKGKESATKIKGTVIDFYKEFGFTLYEPLVKKWATLLKIDDPIKIEMVNFPKRMGSCSVDGTLKFAIRSVMLPFDLLDYLALHEVAHLIHFNHSPEFKTLLHMAMGDWKERQKELRRYRLVTATI
ncbi:MAG: SprT family zinc-dependent metalloprotease [Sphaerochaetaceae bacterium]